MKLAPAIAWISAVSSASAFTGISSFNTNGWPSFVANADPAAAATGYRDSWLMYENARDGNQGSDSSNVWSVLAHTEKWISDTLASSETGNGNPYSRKEVNYVCETNEESPMIAANMFKRLREARELGQRHGESEVDRRVEQGSNYRAHTMRQTQVMVIPGNKDLCEDFHVFDGFINAVNAARRNARDYVTDSSLDKLDQELAGEENLDWSVSVNCAHLHPEFGKKTAEETLQEMEEEEEQGEVDVHLQEYAEKRLLARQSPFPTIVVEVRATPPPDWGEHVTAPPMATEEETTEEEEDIAEEYNYNRKELLKKEVTSADIQALEALFGKAAAKEHPRDGKKETTERKAKERDFYASIGNNIEEISSISHMQMAQEWISDNDEKVCPLTSAFTESDAPEIDHGYEFVFTNIAMMQQQAKHDKVSGSRRQYLVMPHFLSSSATSLEKFTTEVMNIVNTLPELRQKVKISTFHPEHVQKTRRAPLSIVCLKWTEDGGP